jgi:hypothetical protein
MEPLEDTPLTPPGIGCPVCREAAMALAPDHRGRPALTCATCHVLVRLLQRHGDAAPVLDGGDQEATELLPGSW